MFHHLKFNKKQVITPEQLTRKVDAENTRVEAQNELVEARELAQALRIIRDRNHFAEGFRKAIGGQGGH